MPTRKIEKQFSNEGSRNSVRKRVVNAFLKEEPGKDSKEHASNYIYYVETLQTGKRV